MEGSHIFYEMQGSINFNRTHEIRKQTKNQQSKVIEFCQKIKGKSWNHYPECAAFSQYMKSKSRYLDNLKDLV
jgi:hypothetical protein